MWTKEMKNEMKEWTENHIRSIASLIEPGKPILVTGPHGNAKVELSSRALTSRGYSPQLIHMPVWELSERTRINRASTSIGFIIDLFHSSPSRYSQDAIDFVLYQMEHPERAVVLTAQSCAHQQILSKVYKQINIPSFFDPRT